MRSRHLFAIIFSAILAICATAMAARADPFSVNVSAFSQQYTNGVFGCYVGPPWPCSTVSHSSSGATSASTIATDTVTENCSGCNPPSGIGDGFGSASASEGHIGISADAFATGISVVSSSASANWTDVGTVVSSILAPGTPVQVLARLSIDAEFVGLGYGSSSIYASFNGGTIFTLSTNGGDSSTGPLTLPATVTEQFDAYVGETINLSGSANGAAFADNLNNPDGYEGTDSNWSVVATDSAHFMLTPLTAGIDITTASGCSITNGYGCDPVPTTVPEPSSVLILASSLLGLAWLMRSRRKLRAAPLKR
jgi:hypothetical protein